MARRLAGDVVVAAVDLARAVVEIGGGEPGEERPVLVEQAGQELLAQLLVSDPAAEPEVAQVALDDERRAWRRA